MQIQQGLLRTSRVCSLRAFVEVSCKLSNFIPEAVTKGLFRKIGVLTILVSLTSP